MFETSSKIIDAWKKNIVIKKHINLDKDLDCFVLISSNDLNFSEIILNKIFDSTIDKISHSNTYDDFTYALENINSITKTWEKDNDKKIKVDIIVSILKKNNFMFSTIWKPSCYLIKANKEIVEITEKNENKKEFNFISSWELNDGEIIIIWTKRLLNYLSNNDLIDWLEFLEIKDFSKNIKKILLSEILDENIAICSIKYSAFWKVFKKSKDRLLILKQLAIRLLDNKITKNIIARVNLLKERLYKQSKQVKNIIFISWIIVSFIFLYITVSGVILLTNNSNEKEESKEDLVQAKQLVRLASENVANPEIFEQNIKKAEEIVFEVKDKKLFLNDIWKILDDISIIKKQFNNIEIFEENEDNIIYRWNLENSVKVIKSNSKLYIIKHKSIIWPIISWKQPEENVFDKLELEEIFIDAHVLWNEIILLTNFSKIVSFNKNSYFSYKDTIWQKTWEESDDFSSYGQNIYLLSKERNQIFKHKKSGNNFWSWIAFLKKEDSENIWKILSIWIDWWIYMLKEDLSLIKVFASPKYRLESIILNKLPKNYELENSKNKIEIKAWINLNYIYLLLNEKIWVFKPNTKRFQDTKNLNYIWQIEWKNEKIKDFFVNHDWELVVLNKWWVYKLDFEISDEKLIIR